MFVPAEDDEVIFKAVPGEFSTQCFIDRGVWRSEVQTYRISNRVKAFRPVTEVKGLNDSIAWDRGNFPGL